MTWLYKKTNLFDSETLIKIQAELVTLSKFLLKRVNKTALWVVAPSTTAKSVCPILNSALEKNKLAEDFTAIGFSRLGHGTDFSIHTDEEKYSLNIPVINCENSFTIFYDIKSLKEVDTRPTTDYYFNKNAIDWHVRPIKNFSSDRAIEIGRCEYTQPYWINVSQPHLPYSLHNNNRILAVLRFNKNVEQMLEDHSCPWIIND